MNNLSTAGTRINSNYTNYIYEVPGTTAEDRYLLFNPSIHYWIAVSEWGATVAKELDRADLRILQDHLERRFGIDQLAFGQQVLPFVDGLLELGFFTLEKTPRSARWVPDDFSLESPDSYPFNDLFVSLSDTCNLDCVYCFNKENRAERLKRRPARKLSPKAIIRAMSDFKALGGSGVCFTGGEPTLYPGLLGLCSAGKGIGLTTHFITNGTMLGRMDAELLMDAVDGFAVSLDALDNNVVSRLWGTSLHDARQEILEPLVNIANLAAARGKDLRITIKPIVSSVNSEFLQPMVSEVTSLLSRNQVSWDFGRYERIGNPEIDRLFEVSDAAYLQTMVGCLETLYPELRSSEIPSDGSQLGGFGHESVRAILGHFGKLQPGRQVAILPCIPSFFIARSGDVYPCQGLEVDEFCLGNAADATMSELFDHPAFAGLRTRMTADDIEVCGDCEFRYVCARHCHGDAQKRHGRTTAFIHDDTEACRSRVVMQLWLETRDLVTPGTEDR